MINDYIILGRKVRSLAGHKARRHGRLSARALPSDLSKKVMGNLEEQIKFMAVHIHIWIYFFVKTYFTLFL
jgi:hypothetical protein